MSRLIFILAFTVSVSPVDAFVKVRRSTEPFTDQIRDLFINQINFVVQDVTVEQKIRELARLTNEKDTTKRIKEAIGIVDEGCAIDLRCPAAVPKVKEFCDKIRPQIQDLTRISGNEYKKECDRIAKQFKVKIKTFPDRTLKLCRSELGPVAKIYEKVLEIFPSTSSLGPADIFRVLQPVVGGFDGFVKLLKGKGGAGFEYVMTLIDTASSILGVGAKVLNVATHVAKGGMGGVGNLLSGLLGSGLGLLKGLIASIVGILSGLGG